MMLAKLEGVGLKCLRRFASWQNWIWLLQNRGQTILLEKFKNSWFLFSPKPIMMLRQRLIIIKVISNSKQLLVWILLKHNFSNFFVCLCFRKFCCVSVGKGTELHEWWDDDRFLILVQHYCHVSVKQSCAAHSNLVQVWCSCEENFSHWARQADLWQNCAALFFCSHLVLFSCS